MSTALSGHRPASYPSPPKLYEAGALALRRFLQQTQQSVYRNREFHPALLREHVDHNVGLLPLDYRAGFMDALGAYVLLTLEGCQLDPKDWDVLAMVKRR
ncbi:hypothetical protein [Ralstonia sp. A12]|uniref:hypothetical protein n=1 Tax=Ralstonia sp. A12 TaxID=1217052 RepID=UPI0006947931|nr:hypothetical protein [Ralstonia sp. A12]